jgi:hypothetical protein
LDTVEQKYKEVIDQSKMIEAAPASEPQVSAPGSTSRIGNTVRHLEKGLSHNDLVAGEYIDNAVMKHIDFALPKNIPQDEKINETHSVQYHDDGTIHLGGDDHISDGQEFKQGALEPTPVPYVSPAEQEVEKLNSAVAMQD